jgi:hypothetical protein
MRPIHGKATCTNNGRKVSTQTYCFNFGALEFRLAVNEAQVVNLANEIWKQIRTIYLRVCRT